MLATILLLVGSFSVAMSDCPDPHELYGGSCYFIDRERGYTYSQAADYCAGYGAKLVTVTDEDEQDFLSSFLQSGPGTAAWIGFTDVEEEGNFVWNDGTPVTYQNWMEGAPNNHDNADCVLIRSWDAKWNDRNCEKPYGAICEHPVDVVDCEAFPDSEGRVVTYDNTPTDGVYPEKTKATFECMFRTPMDLMGPSEAICLTTGWTQHPYCRRKAPPCPDAWTYYNWNCYAVSRDTMSGMDARFFCGFLLGAEQVDIRDANENAILTEEIKCYGNAYIGLSDESTEGTFVWSDGTTPEYLNWSEDQPNDFSNSDCVVLRPAGDWNDVPCGERYHAACKKPAVY